MKDNIRNAVQQSFRSLLVEDGELFDCPIETDTEYDSRKLHEVCLNHRLACHLETNLKSVIANIGERMFVDIEFNREGDSYKKLMVNGKENVVRPDIIVHNRRSGSNRNNLLVVECKRDSARENDIQRDTDKIKAFIGDVKYQYSFGLQVIYAKAKISGTLFFMDSGTLCEETVEYSQQVGTERE